MIPRHLQIAISVLLVGLLGASVYMFQLRRRDERTRLRAADTRPVTAPVTGPTVPVHLAIAYDEDGVVSKRDVNIPLPNDESTRAREILRALLSEYLQKPSPHSVGDGSDVKAIYFVEGGLCVIDMNVAFADGHRSGIAVEEFTIATMVESLALNMPSVRRVKFLVDGKDRETLAGHADLALVYDVDAVHQLVEGLKKP